jgi:hypothetical protein
MDSWPCRSIRRCSHCGRTIPENEPDISATLHVVVRRSAGRRKCAALRRQPKAKSAQRCLAIGSSMLGIAFRKMLKCSSPLMAQTPHIVLSNSDHWKTVEFAGCTRMARCANSSSNHLENYNRPWPHLAAFYPAIENPANFSRRTPSTLRKISDKMDVHARPQLSSNEDRFCVRLLAKYGCVLPAHCFVKVRITSFRIRLLSAPASGVGRYRLPLGRSRSCLTGSPSPSSLPALASASEFSM